MQYISQSLKTKDFKMLKNNLYFLIPTEFWSFLNKFLCLLPKTTLLFTLHHNIKQTLNYISGNMRAQTTTTYLNYDTIKNLSIMHNNYIFLVLTLMFVYCNEFPPSSAPILHSFLLKVISLLNLTDFFY